MKAAPGRTRTAFVLSLDTPSVSPADFSRTEELIRTRRYRSARRYVVPLMLAPRQRVGKAAIKLTAGAARAA